MAIYVITGKTGHGKTAYMTQWVRDSLRSGKRVFLNYKIYPEMLDKKFSPEIQGDIKNKSDRENPEKKVLYWSDYTDWFLMEHGTIFCDEGIVYFNARLWESLPHEIQIKLVQHRKESLDLVLNIQHYTFMEKTIRMLAERFIHAELKLGSPKFKDSFIPRIAKIYEFDLPTLNRCENLGIDPFNVNREEAEKYRVEPLYSEWFWIRKKIFSWYDTTLQVSESRPAPLRHIVRTCPDCGHESIKHS